LRNREKGIAAAIHEAQRLDQQHWAAFCRERVPLSRSLPSRSKLRSELINDHEPDIVARGHVFGAGISKTRDQANLFFFHRRQSKNPKTCPERSEAESNGSKIENGLLLLLLLLGTLFLRSRSRRRSSFA